MPAADDTIITAPPTTTLPAVARGPDWKRRAAVTAAWLRVAILLLIAAGVGLVDWRILHL